MKRMFFIFLVVAGAVAIAAPIRSMLGADGAALIEGGMPTAADYVQDGLLCMLDCIENAGYGEHTEGLLPTDLAGNAIITKTGSVAVGDDSFTLSDGACLSFDVTGIDTAMDSNEFTIQICGKFGHSGNNVPILGIGNRGLWIWRGNGYTIAEMTLKTTGYNNVSRVKYINDDRFSFSIVGGMNPYLSFLDGTTTSAWYGTLESIGTTTVTIGKMGTLVTGADREYCAFRIYNRVLSPSEIRYNHLIDKMRFNIE